MHIADCKWAAYTEVPCLICKSAVAGPSYGCCCWILVRACFQVKLHSCSGSRCIGISWAASMRQEHVVTIADWAIWCCSITRDNLGPYKVKVLVIPTVYLVTTMVSLDLRRTAIAWPETCIIAWRCPAMSITKVWWAKQFACRSLTTSQTAHMFMTKTQISLKALTW